LIAYSVPARRQRRALERRANALMAKLDGTLVRGAEDVAILCEGHPPSVFAPERARLMLELLGGVRLADEALALPPRPSEARMVVVIGDVFAVGYVGLRMLQNGGDA